MMDVSFLSDLSKIWENPTIMGVGKWMFVAGLFLYIIFSLVILKQTLVMSETIDGKYNTGVKIFAFLNLTMAILLMGTTFVIL
jgi:hypothetical protein